MIYITIKKKVYKRKENRKQPNEKKEKKKRGIYIHKKKDDYLQNDHLQYFQLNILSWIHILQVYCNQLYQEYLK